MPNFEKLPFPHAFDIYKFHMKNNDLENLKHFEESLISTEPSSFIELCKKFYVDKIIK